MHEKQEHTCDSTNPFGTPVVLSEPGWSQTGSSLSSGGAQTGEQRRVVVARGLSRDLMEAQDRRNQPAAAVLTSVEPVRAAVAFLVRLQIAPNVTRLPGSSKVPLRVQVLQIKGRRERPQVAALRSRNPEAEARRRTCPPSNDTPASGTSGNKSVAAVSRSSTDGNSTGRGDTGSVR